MQCRCCLSRQPPLFGLFELNLDLVLSSVASVVVERNDGLPAFACEDCVRKAKAALKFKRQCEQLDRSMRRLLRLSRRGSPEECETVQSGYDDGTEDGLKEADSILEEAATLSPEVRGDGSTPRPFDHGYCRSFDAECSEVEEQFLEQEEHLDGMESDWHDRDDAVSSSSKSNSAILGVGAADDAFIETDKVRENQPHGEGWSTNQRSVLQPETTSPASFQMAKHPVSTKTGPRRERDEYSCDGCGRGFSRSTFLKRHTVRCVLRRDLRRGSQAQSAVPACELCGRTFRWHSFLRRHRQICKGRAEVDFIRDVVDHYTDRQFRQHFRMTRATVDSLVDSFRRSEFYRVRMAGGRPEIPAQAQILSFLWFCGKNTTFGKVCRVFRFAMASFHKHMNLILDFLHRMARDVIKFPASNGEKEQISLEFAKIVPMTNVLGCIDSCLINCVRYNEARVGTDAAPNSTASTGSLRNPGCGVLLQAIADPSGKLMDVNTELMVSTDHDDGRQFSRSAIARRLESVCQNGRFHLLASAPYPLRAYLLTPFAAASSNANSARPANDLKVIAYNKTLDVALDSTIMMAFRALKSRFPVLLKLRFFSREKVCRFVLACCVLHNVCIDAGETAMVEDPEEDHGMEEREEAAFSADRFWQRPYRERSADDVEELVEAGKAKRNQILMSMDVQEICLLERQFVGSQ